MAALLVASEPAFVVVKIAGAAYLIFLGGQSLLAAVRHRPRAAHGVRPADGRELRQGFVSNLGNPKMAVFFSSLLRVRVAVARAGDRRAAAVRAGQWDRVDRPRSPARPATGSWSRA